MPVYLGTVKTRDGTPLAGATVAFAPVPTEMGEAPGFLLLPRAVRASSDSSGVVAITLLPGRYAVRVTTASGRHVPTFLIDAPGDWLVEAPEDPLVTVFAAGVYEKGVYYVA